MDHNSFTKPQQEHCYIFKEIVISWNNIGILRIMIRIWCIKMIFKISGK